MKKIIIKASIFAFSFILASSLSAATIYVSAMKTSLYKDAKTSSGKIKMITKGTKLSVLSKKGSWIEVKARGKKGWVKKMFTSRRAPGKRLSLLGNKTNVKIQARRRASFDVSAASARGLDEDGTKTPARVREIAKLKASFNPEMIDKIQTYVIPEKEIIAFLQKGNLFVN